MPPKRLSRRALLAAALVESNMTMGEFAAECGVSKTHVYRVLDDPTASAPLTGDIDEFTRRWTGMQHTP